MRTRKAWVSNAVLLTGLLWASQTTVFADKGKHVPAIPALLHGHHGLLSPHKTGIGRPDPAAAVRESSPKNMPAAAAIGLDNSKSKSPDHGGSKTSDHGKSKSSKHTDEASQLATVETTASESKSIDQLPTCY